MSVALASLSRPASALLQSRAALFEAFEIGKHQFGFDGVGVGQRIDAAFDMGHVVIVETAQHISDGVDFADVGEKLIAQPFALGRAFDEAGNVHEGETRRQDLRGFGDGGDAVETLVGHRHVADIGLDGAKRIVRRLGGSGLRQSIEQRGFADIGQSDDAASKAHR